MRLRHDIARLDRVKQPADLHSLVPMAARAAAIDFDELVWQLLESSLARARIDS
jgi:hypothetical protein